MRQSSQPAPLGYAGEPPPPYTPRGEYCGPQPQQGFQVMQYPPGTPGQYPLSAAPGQLPPPGAPGHYPPPGAPGQYPPPGVPGRYPPPSAPGQYPPPGAPRQYPPPGAPGQYPPSGAPGQYPPPGAPGQYPPPGVPGQYPPPGAPGQYFPPQPPNQYPPIRTSVPPSPATIGPDGYDAVDSESDNYVCTKNSKHPLQVTFTNRTGNKVSLLWLDERGSCEKITSLRANASKGIDTFETHPFLAESSKDKEEVVINGNFVFFPQIIPGRNGIDKAEITKAPNIGTLRSPISGYPVRVMFSNRTDLYITMKWINANGQQQAIKDIAPKKAWVLNSCDGHYFIACERGQNENKMELNMGLFYMVRRGPNPQNVVKVLITEEGDRSSSSSASS